MDFEPSPEEVIWKEPCRIKEFRGKNEVLWGLAAAYATALIGELLFSKNGGSCC